MPPIRSFKDFAIFSRHADSKLGECKRCFKHPHSGHLWPTRWYPQNLEPLNLTFTTIGYSRPPASTHADKDFEEMEAELQNGQAAISPPGKLTWRDNRVVSRCITGLRYIKGSTNRVIHDSENTKVDIIHGFVVLALTGCARLQLVAYDDPMNCRLYMRKLCYSRHSCWISPDMVILRNPKYGSISEFLPVLFSRNQAVPQAHAIAYILAHAQLRFVKYAAELVTHVCVLQFIGRSVQFVSANVTRSYIESVEENGTARGPLLIATSRAFDLGESKGRVEFRHALGAVLEEMFPPVEETVQESQWRRYQEQLYGYDSGTKARTWEHKPQTPGDRAHLTSDLGINCDNGTTPFKGTLKRKFDHAELTINNIAHMLKRRAVVPDSEMEGLTREVKDLSDQIERFVRMKKAQEKMQCEIECLSEEIEEKTRLGKSKEENT